VNKCGARLDPRLGNLRLQDINESIPTLLRRRDHPIRAGCSRTHTPNDEPNYSTATVTRKYVAAITVVSLLELLF
jgi:hypothetical protein